MEDTESSGRVFNQQLEIFHSYLSNKKKEFVTELTTDFILFKGICKRFESDASEIVQAHLEAISQCESLEISDFLLKPLSDVVIKGSKIDAIHDLTKPFNIIFCDELHRHPKLLSKINTPTLIYHTGNAQGISRKFIIATIWMNVEEHSHLFNRLSRPILLLIGISETREIVRTLGEYIERLESPFEKIYKQQAILFEREAALSKQQTEMLAIIRDMSNNTCKCLIA